MKRSLTILMLLALLMTAASAAPAYDGDDIMIVGPVVKLIKSTVGTVVSVKEEEADGKKTAAVELEDESGETKIFPIDATVKIVDGALGVMTLRDLQKGQKVAVEQAQSSEGEKVETIKVVK